MLCTHPSPMLVLSALLLASPATTTQAQETPACLILPKDAKLISGGPCPDGYACRFKSTYAVPDASGSFDEIYAEADKRFPGGFSAMGDGSYIIYPCGDDLDAVVDFTNTGDGPDTMVVEVTIKGG
jgi:hypothetical protein